MFSRLYTVAIGWLLLFGSQAAFAQSPVALITELQRISDSLTREACGGRVATGGAMNLFLSDRVGSYLSSYNNLSFYKNYVTFNTADGVFSLNHNLFQQTGIDNPVRGFYMVGVKAKVSPGIANTVNGNYGRNQLGVTVQKTWIAQPRTVVNNCAEKKMLDVRRIAMLNRLRGEIRERQDKFEGSLPSNLHGMPDTAFNRVIATMRRDFDAALRDEFATKFAAAQYAELIDGAPYKRITTYWTNVSIYAPVIADHSLVGQSLNSQLATMGAYPIRVAINHTRFLETRKSGRFFLNVEASIASNNSAASRLLQNLTIDEYRSLNGADAATAKAKGADRTFIGKYRHFITPAAKFNVVYYPNQSHIGISAAIEQNIGVYKALNGTIGIPIVLIDKKGAPAANFEFNLHYFDINHAVFPDRAFKDNVYIALTAAVPFSKIIH
nr:hypothetical protein [uncultured Mucilaginibacter sp.]